MNIIVNMNRICYSLCSTMPLQYVLATDANRPEKRLSVKSICIKTTACMVKLSVKHSFIIYCG